MTELIVTVGEDGWEGVAETYGADKRETLKRNGMKEAELRKGVKLLITPRRGERYVVRPFETLSAIAAKFGINIDDISRNNGGVTNVYAGEVLYIPSGKGDEAE